MDVAEAQMQDQRAREAEQARAQSIQSGVAGIAGMASAAAPLVPLFGQSSADKRAAKTYESLDKTQLGGKSKQEVINILSDKY